MLCNMYIKVPFTRCLILWCLSNVKQLTYSSKSIGSGSTRGKPLFSSFTHDTYCLCWLFFYLTIDHLPYLYLIYKTKQEIYHKKNPNIFLNRFITDRLRIGSKSVHSSRFSNDEHFWKSSFAIFSSFFHQSVLQLSFLCLKNYVEYRLKDKIDHRIQNILIDF